VGSGSQTEDEHAGEGIAKAGYGARPVFAVEVGAALIATDTLAVLDEAGATATAHDLCL
jgi:hypothetical protein